MTIIKRDQVTPPALRKETVTVEPLGGDVVVRELTLTERLALRDDEADSNGGTKRMLQLVSFAVVDADGASLFTPAEWNAFGAQNGAIVNDLFGKAMTLSGFDGEANRKN